MKQNFIALCSIYVTGLFDVCENLQEMPLFGPDNLPFRYFSCSIMLVSRFDSGSVIDLTRNYDLFYPLLQLIQFGKFDTDQIRSASSGFMLNIIHVEILH